VSRVAFEGVRSNISYSLEPGIGTGVCAIGVFDGVHRGHRHLISQMVEAAHALDLPSVIVTFDIDPEELFLTGGMHDKLLSNDERVELLASLGATHVQVITFDERLSSLAPDAFCDEVLARFMEPVQVHVGEDFRFGAGAAGTAGDLKAWGAGHRCTCVTHPLYRLRDGFVTATRIRGLLASGEVIEAGVLLGRDHRLRGKVVHGVERGRELGFPTANVEVPGCCQTVCEGVYAGYVGFGEQRVPAAISVGASPTFPDAPGRLECHLIGFEGDLYGQEVTVTFVVRLRSMTAFATVDELVASIGADISWVRDHLGTWGGHHAAIAGRRHGVV
jgi:riboflavin kinase/FMN adenylyltransferase